MASKTSPRTLKRITGIPLLREAHDLAAPNAVNLTPLGAFFDFPRELRDEIYSHVCNQKPYEFNRESDDGFSHVDRKKWWGHGIPMLQVSTIIREEFQAVLYAEGVFAISHPHFSPKTARDDIPFVNHISNITILNLDLFKMSDGFRSYLQENPSYSDEEELISARKAEPVSYFTGTSIKRNTCVIKLDRCGRKTLISLLSSPFMRAMAQLTGFKTVQLHFTTNADVWLKDETLQEVRNAFYELGTCPGFDALVLQTSSALEPTLGSCTVTHGTWLDESRYWDQHVTFHPQGHPTKKADRLELESSTRIRKTPSASSFLEWTARYQQ